MNTQNVDAFVERFNQDDGGFPESWKPRPGSEIIGTVIRYDQAESKFGGTRLIAVLECLNAGGKPYLCAVWLGHQVLLNEFARKRPKPGERVAIKRLDDVKGKDGGTYAKYVLHVDRPLAALEPNWEAFGATSNGTLPATSGVTEAAPKAKDDGEDDDLPF